MQETDEKLIKKFGNQYVGETQHNWQYKLLIQIILTGNVGMADPGTPGTVGGGSTGTAAGPGSTDTGADGRLGIDAPGKTAAGKTGTAPGRAEPRTRLDGGIISAGSAGGTGVFSRARQTKCMAFSPKIQTIKVTGI